MTIGLRLPLPRRRSSIRHARRSTATFPAENDRSVCLAASATRSERINASSVAVHRLSASNKLYRFTVAQRLRTRPSTAQALPAPVIGIKLWEPSPPGLTGRDVIGQEPLSRCVLIRKSRARAIAVVLGRLDQFSDRVRVIRYRRNSFPRSSTSKTSTAEVRFV